MNPKSFVIFTALVLTALACTSQIDSAQQVIECPLESLEERDFTRDRCIEKLTMERDGLRNQLKQSLASESRLLTEIQIMNGLEPGPILNEKERWVAECLKPSAETIATTAPDIRQALHEAREAYRHCRPELTIYHLMDEASQVERYPNIRATPEEIQKHLDRLVFRKLQALYAAVTVKEGFTPTLFCDDDCEIKGRYELVDELVMTLEAGNLHPEDIQTDLTQGGLADLRLQGIKELFDLWSAADNDSSLKVQGKSRLCFELDQHPTASGLSDTELTELNCGTTADP